MHIQEKDKKVNGNAGCNNFSGAVSIHKDSIAFNKPMAMSMMACNG
ncbi:META domain-containing protein, partial [Vibrio parahaemolyticus]